MGTCSVIPRRENACVGGYDITVSVNRKKIGNKSSAWPWHSLCVNITLRCRWILSSFRSSNRTKVGGRAKEMKVQFISLFCSHLNILHELARKRLLRRQNFQKSSFFSLNFEEVRSISKSLLSPQALRFSALWSQ